MSFIVSVEPLFEAVAATDFRQFYLNIYDSTKDTGLDELAKTVRKYFEQKFDMAIPRQTIKEYYSLGSLTEVIPLTVYPFTALSTITYYDTDDNPQTFATSNYSIDYGKKYANLHILDTATVPDLKTKKHNVEITYTVGYASASLIPDPIKKQIIICVGRMYYDKLGFDRAMKNLELIYPYTRKKA